MIVPDDQLSLAIGKEGLNARLAARLTGWRVDIRSETEFAEDEAEMGYQEEETATGRCAAILTNGRRCPNAALPGSRYCGLPPHQALVDQEGDQLSAAADDDAGDEIAPESVEPEAVEPEPVEPEAAEPVEPVEPEPAEPEATEPEPVEPDGSPAAGSVTQPPASEETS